MVENIVTLIFIFSDCTHQFSQIAHICGQSQIVVLLGFLSILIPESDRKLGVRDLDLPSFRHQQALSSFQGFV